MDDGFIPLLMIVAFLVLIFYGGFMTGSYNEKIGLEMCQRENNVFACEAQYVPMKDYKLEVAE